MSISKFNPNPKVTILYEYKGFTITRVETEMGSGQVIKEYEATEVDDLICVRNSLPKCRCAIDEYLKNGYVECYE